MNKKTTLLFVFSSLLILSAYSVKASVGNADVHEQEDPWESFNRPMFTFNYNLDKFILKPAAKGYRKITTKDVRERVRSSIANLKEPATAANYLLQGKVLESVTSIGRFVVNSTLGLAGLFDVATGWGWKLEKTNFGETLGFWCIPDGPYLVLPFIGSSTPRSAVGLAADSFADPVYWATADREDGMYATVGYAAIKGIVAREATIEIGDDLERNSVDFYITMRSTYLQNKNKVQCFGRPAPEEATYDFDFDNEE